MPMVNVHLQLPAELLARIDGVRRTDIGEVARNQWIRLAIERQLEQLEAERAKPPRRRSA